MQQECSATGMLRNQPDVGEYGCSCSYLITTPTLTPAMITHNLQP
mgnify:CR=1 FL=1